MNFGPVGECQICHEAHYFDTSAGRDHWLQEHICKPVEVKRFMNDQPGDDQPLGEHPEIHNWVNVIERIDHLADTALHHLREAQRDNEELRRRNIALDARVYQLTVKLDAAVAESATWRARATGGGVL